MHHVLGAIDTELAAALTGNFASSVFAGRA
jgi:hypothetical protein